MTSGLLPPLILELRAKAGEVHSEIKAVGSEVDGMAAKTEAGMGRGQVAMAKMAGAGKALTFGLAGAAVVVGAASLKLGTDFQESTTQLVTGAGETEENLGKIRSGLLQMAPAVGMGPDALAKAMFLVESAGFHGADGLNVMKAAAEGAKIGGADATVVANGLTTALDDYHLPASQAADVTSKLVATVAAGKTSMSDLAGSLSSVLPTAAAAKVGLDQVLGAMGTMTGEGISAQQASQDLAGTIRSLGNPSAVATKAMAQMGLNSIDVAKQLGQKGLTGTLDELSQAVLKHMGPSGLVLQSSFNESKLAAQSADEMLTKLPKSLQTLAKGYLDGTVTQKQWQAELKTQPALVANLAKQFSTTAKQAHGFSDDLRSGSGAAKTYNALMSDMTGGATGLATTLALTGGNMKTFKSNTDTIGKASAEAGGHVKGWADTQKDFSTQMAQAKAGVEAMGVKIGLALIPVVQSAIRVGTQWTDYLIQHKPLLYTIAGLVGGVMVTAITAYVASVVAGAISSVASFATMVAGWFGVGVAAEEAGTATTLALGPIGLAVAAVAIGAYELYKHWNTVWGAIKAVAVGAWHWADDIFHNKITQIVLGLVAPALFLALHWHQTWSDMETVALAAWHFLDSDVLHPIESGFTGFVKFVSGIPAALDKFFSGMFDGLVNAGKSAFDWIADAWNETVGSLSFHIPSWVPGVGGKGFSMPQIPTFATGGSLDLTGWNWVGENGAELVGPGARVYSNRDSSRILNDTMTPHRNAATGSTGAGSAQSVVVNMPVYLDGKVIAEHMERFNLQIGARRGGAYQQNRKA